MANNEQIIAILDSEWKVLGFLQIADGTVIPTQTGDSAMSTSSEILSKILNEVHFPIKSGVAQGTEEGTFTHGLMEIESTDPNASLALAEHLQRQGINAYPVWYVLQSTINLVNNLATTEDRKKALSHLLYVPESEAVTVATNFEELQTIKNNEEKI